jgi:hypothetical protein
LLGKTFYLILQDQLNLILEALSTAKIHFS